MFILCCHYNLFKTGVNYIDSQVLTTSQTMKEIELLVDNAYG